MRKYLFLVIGLFVYTSSVLASTDRVYSANVNLNLMSEAPVVEAGRSFWIGLQMTMDEGWHAYWKNPGDSGMATRIEWDLPEGFEVGDIQWSNPKRIDYDEDLTGYGLSGQVILLSKVKTPKKIQGNGNIPIKATVKWLSCKNICMPGTAEVSTTIQIHDEQTEINKLVQRRFLEEKQKWPAFKSSFKLSAIDQGDSVILNIVPDSIMAVELNDIQFFPYRDDIIDHAKQQTLKKGEEGYELILSKSVVLDESEKIKQLQGILISDKSWVNDQAKNGLFVDVSVRR